MKINPESEMFELFQIVWDLLMVRRSVRNGQLTLRKAAIAIGLTILLYVTVIPAAALYDKHPEYKPLFIAAVVFGAANFLFLIFLGFHWWQQWAAQQSQAHTSN
jgi:Na+/melibiose symporter-like transporter